MDMKSSSSSSSLEAQASNKDLSEIDDVLISLIDKDTEIPPIPPSIYFAGCAYGACFCKSSTVNIIVITIIIMYHYHLSL